MFNIDKHFVDYFDEEEEGDEGIDTEDVPEMCLTRGGECRLLRRIV